MVDLTGLLGGLGNDLGSRLPASGAAKQGEGE